MCLQVAELSARLSEVSLEKARLESRNNVLEKVRRSAEASIQTFSTSCKGRQPHKGVLDSQESWQLLQCDKSVMALAILLLGNTVRDGGRSSCCLPRNPIAYRLSS